MTMTHSGYRYPDRMLTVHPGMGPSPPSCSVLVTTRPSATVALGIAQYSGLLKRGERKKYASPAAP